MMRLAHPAIGQVFSFEENAFHTLVVEHPVFFRQLVEDLYAQTCGLAGEWVLSQDYTPLKLSGSLELLTQFIPFEANRKTLLTKITAALEKRAVNEQFFVHTQRLLSQWEQYLYDLAQDLSGDLVFEKVNTGSLIKAGGVQIAQDEGDLPERMLSYMDLVRELEGEKLFVLVNVRSFLSEEELTLLLKTALGNKHNLLLMDSAALPLLPGEQRWTVDRDLCEF